MDTALLDAGTSRRACQLSRRFMMRVAGLPIEAVHGLRCPDARQWADGVLTGEARLRDQGAALSDRLAALVAAHEDGGRRSKMLALRRDVFNNRLPGNLPAAHELAGLIGGSTGELVATWLADRQRHEELRSAGAAAFAENLARSRAELRRLAAEDRLRMGLLLASPTLEGQLEAFAGNVEATTGKRGRKLERSLLAYLYRTACKTSPFSTFTSVTHGQFQPADGDVVTVGSEWDSHPRLNVVVLARIAEVIAANARRRSDLPVALASGLELGEDRIRYVRRSMTAGDDSKPAGFDAARDRVFFLRRSGNLERLLELLRQRPGIRCGEVLAWLRAHARAEPEEAECYLASLLDLGLLQLPVLATDVHAQDPLRSFQSALRSLGRPWAEAVAERLEGPVSWISRYPAADVPARRAILTRLRQELLDIQTELGATAASLPQALLYEDVTLAAARADLGTWGQLAAEPLHELSAVFPAYDNTLAQRLTLRGFFLARYGRGGRCEDLLALVHDFHEDIFDLYQDFTRSEPQREEDGSPLEENWMRLPEITALDRARHEFTDQMRRAWAGHRDAGEEFWLDPATVRSVAAELAPIPRGFEPQSYFLQLARRDGDPLVVLNNAYGGLCFPFTRFTHCFDGQPSTGLSADLRKTLRTWQPDGAVFAEITAGSATTNLNLHGRLTDYEIVCPSESSTAAPAARLHLDDLYVEHDEAADRLVLRSRRLNREVVPVYFGYLIPMALPEIPRTLLLLSPTFQVTPDLWRGVPEGPAVDGVTSRPRVRYGSVVLHRRSWTAKAGALPVRESGSTDAERYLQWQRWRRRHGLTEQVFAKVYEAVEPGPGTGRFGRAKPQYVDFGSPLSLLALDGVLGRRRVEVVFEEMLPTEDDLSVKSELGQHVAEFAVEVISASLEKGALA
jgi:Lantibiotic dehydratase, N terminus